MKTIIDDKIAENTRLPEGKRELTVRDTVTKGLCLRIRPGSRTWTYIKEVRKKRHRVVLGAFPALDTEAARIAVAGYAKKLADNIDITEEVKEKAKEAATVGVLFGDNIDAFLKAKERGIGHRKPLKASTLRDMRTYLEQRCRPLHKRPVVDMTKGEVSRFLDTLATDHTPVVADRVRAAMSSYWSWLLKRTDGLDSHIVLATDRPAPVVERDRVLTGDELGAIWKATSGPGDYARIIRLLLLTGLRWAEIANLRWSEVQGDKLVISGDRTKNRLPVQQPLSDLAQAELARVEKGEHDTVFGTAGTGYHHNSKAKGKLDEASKVKDWRVHDLRRTFSTRLNELGVDPWIADALLNHKRQGVEAVYNRAGYEQAKADAVALYADHIKGLIPAPALEVVA